MKRSLGLAFGAGLAAAAGQAPLGLWWLAVPAYALVTYLVIRAPNARAGFLWAWAAGVGHFGAALSWIVQPFFVDPVRHGWMAPFALVLMAGGLALFWGLAGWAAVRRGGRICRALLFGLCLTLAEALRGMVLTGFPWALPGHIWIDTPVMQAAAWIGPNGLTLLTLVLALLPVAFARRGVATAILMLAVVWSAGLLRLAGPEPEPRGVTLRLVQPNAEQSLKWDPDEAERLFRLQLDFTAAQPAPDLVIWPETALPYLLDPGRDAAAAVARAAQGVPVALGAQRVEGGAAYNSLAVIGAGGALTGLYDKAHLVPFGEYMPMGDVLHAWFGLSAFAARQGHGYAAGPGPRLLDLGDLGKVLPLICYEAVFPNDLRAAPGRADWILQITNDAWFGTLTGPFQHAAQARLRAVEQGLPLVRVANTGVTQVVDARGRVIAGLAFGTAGWLDAALPGALPPTFFARHGDTALLLLLMILALALLTISKHRPLDAYGGRA
ncbi:apolipoprotein N-acyltransferase [Gemmobacter denitrificans]|uniref:Apolipoprotein N-acyltransferase n=1 Tax=Gemmobacter denitrificans TaxID=3123040 RepID=A0ABU8C0S8_9RHOB